MVELDKMQVNIQGVEHDLRQIEQIDSRLYNNEDTQRVIQELRSKYTNNSFANYVSSKRVCYVNLKHACTFDFHSWVHELLMSLKTWASGKVPRASKSRGLLAQGARWNSNIFRALNDAMFPPQITPITAGRVRHENTGVFFFIYKNLFYKNVLRTLHSSG